MLWLVKDGARPPQVPDQDPVAQLAADVQAGRRTLPYDDRFGYLPALLRELRIPVESQTLVFSKTSLQADAITRANPRALYFNDEVYVGYIPGAPLIEIMSVHPQLGARFFTLPAAKVANPTFSTDDRDCVRCHGGRGTQQASLFVRSVHTPPSGYPRVEAPQPIVTSETSLNERWGGWYVTGTHGRQRHLGNEPSLGEDNDFRIDMERGANRTELPSEVKRDRYPIPHSDIVALMIMERQMDVQNTLTYVSRRLANETDAEEIQSLIRFLVPIMMGASEVPLTDPILGTAGFAEAYRRQDPTGQPSLRDLDLRTRLYRYAMHPLVLSPTFRAMKPQAQEEFWRQTDRILRSTGPVSGMPDLTLARRAETRAVLRAVSADFARISGQNQTK